MALHDFPTDMLKDSLRESLEAAKYCVEYKKLDPKWAPNNSEHACLGYPGAVLLFSIIDSIGSYFRKNESFKIIVGSKTTYIKSEGWEHFLILNSFYFENQNLPEEYIKVIYQSLRSRLTHNSITGKNAMMIPRNSVLQFQPPKPLVFFEGVTDKAEKCVGISMLELYELCNRAVNKFLIDVDEIVPKSKFGNNFPK